jgi:SAM-dependent methyltransferase
MEKYLYQDLYELEEKHWWHIAKREVCLKLILKYLAVKEPKILDIGCGTGKNIGFFGQIGLTWGIDSSPEAIRFCKKRGVKNIKSGTGNATGFGSSTFDLVTLLDVLEHTDEDKTLKEINRILKPNGLLVITVPAFPWLWSKWDQVLRHRKRYTQKSLISILLKNNLKVLKSSYLYSFLILPVIIIRSVKSLLFRSNYPSDFKLSSPLINSIGIFFSRIEASIIPIFGIPFGTSLICVAQKNEK